MSEHDQNPPPAAWKHPLTPEERALSTGEAAETWQAFAQLCSAATPRLDEARLLETLRQRLAVEHPPASKPAGLWWAPVWRMPVWKVAAFALAAVLLLAAAIAFWPNRDEQMAQPPAPETIPPVQDEEAPSDAPAPPAVPPVVERDAFASDPPPADQNVSVVPDQVAAAASEWDWEDATWEQDLDAMEQSLTTFRSTWAQGASASATLSAEMESFASELQAESL